ncbi:unnamed protein product [Durusdinium trenchii]|uniref:Uncharacterized protein n=1 Tax=Durusdinium trenchii TaxID=1381693 RepID=A0ABP0HR52_9DINO
MFHRLSPRNMSSHAENHMFTPASTRSSRNLPNAARFLQLLCYHNCRGEPALLGVHAPTDQFVYLDWVLFIVFGIQNVVRDSSQIRTWLSKDLWNSGFLT